MLIAVVVLAVVFAPFLVRIYATPQYTQQQLDLAIAFARFCLPQIFFYGAYTMLSQVLNARGRFGAPMFAPLVNNIVAIATFVLFIVVAGPEAGADGVLEPEQIAILGVGTTLGVVVQALVLVPCCDAPAIASGRGSGGGAPGSGWPAGSRPGPSGSSWSTRSRTPSSCVWRPASTRSSADAGRHARPVSRRTPTPTSCSCCRTRSSRCRWWRRCCRG